MFRTNQYGITEFEPFFVGIIVAIGVGALVLAILWAVIYSAVKAASQPRKPSPPLDVRPAFPVSKKPVAKRFHVVGVNRNTKKQVAETVEAANEESAKAMAEMSGVVVTSVEPA